MAPVDLFNFVLFSHLVILFILFAEYGNGQQQHNCPSSFTCGNLGNFHYPFTKAEQPDCGLLPIHNCDNPQSQKTIQLEKNGETKMLKFNGQAQQNSYALFDEEFHKRLQSGNCDTWNNYTLPSPSPLVSFYIKYNVTLFRCKHILNINPPSSQYYKHPCLEYDIFYDRGLGHNNNTEAHRLFSSCSVLQFPTKDVTDTKDILSFVSAQMVLQVVLSKECDECYNHKGGLCCLGSNKKFSCEHINVAGSMKKRKVSWLLLGLGIGFSLLLGILIIGCFLRRKHASSSNLQQHQARITHTDAIHPYSIPDPENGRVYFGILLFSYQELIEATNNFHPSNQLGIGGFGAVYYGKLRDGREVAVKRLYEHNYRRVQQFTNEIKILTCMRHTNLVSLYGCTSPLSHELLLVYEYVPNGTVACHLQGDLEPHAILPWHIRMTIAIETASALVYLHASDIIHRDVKTKNILLTDTFSVKVADFGLSRLFPHDVTHASTAPQGTPGYVDPEYHQCYQLTTKSDVYSFGVVLIELISSMPAVDMKRHKNDINLANLALKKIQGRAFSELVDPSLGFDSDNEVKRMISSVTELAFQCLQSDKDLRPSMDEVLKMLIIIECGKEHPEEDLCPPSLHSPDWDEIELLKNNCANHIPKAVTD